jgi:hypothetical protein
MGSPRGPPLVLTSNGHRGEGSDDQQRSQPEDSTPRRVARGCGRSSPGAPTQPASWSEARRRLSGRSVVSDPRQQVPPTEVSSSAWSRSRSWRAGKARAVVRQYPLRQLPPCCVRLGTPGVHTTNHRCVGVRCRVVDAPRRSSQRPRRAGRRDPGPLERAHRDGPGPRRVAFGGLARSCQTTTRCSVLFT